MSEILVLAKEPYYNLMTQAEIDIHPQKDKIETYKLIGYQVDDIVCIEDNGFFELPSLGLNIGGRGWNRDLFILIRTKNRLDSNYLISAEDMGEIKYTRKYKIDISSLIVNSAQIYLPSTKKYYNERTCVIDDIVPIDKEIQPLELLNHGR
jgi:hypothetical protein